MEKIIREIADERKRQIEKEGYDPKHDDEHTDGSIANAAAHYASTMIAYTSSNAAFSGDVPKPLFPWKQEYDKKSKHSRRKQLIISAALLVAELERLDRSDGL